MVLDPDDIDRLSRLLRLLNGAEQATETMIEPNMDADGFDVFHDGDVIGTIRRADGGALGVELSS